MVSRRKWSSGCVPIMKLSNGCGWWILPFSSLAPPHPRRLCVQLSQISVCTTESVLCAQVSRLPFLKLSSNVLKHILKVCVKTHTFWMARSLTPQGMETSLTQEKASNQTGQVVFHKHSYQYVYHSNPQKMEHILIKLNTTILVGYQW